MRVGRRGEWRAWAATLAVCWLLPSAGQAQTAKDPQPDPPPGAAKEIEPLEATPEAKIAFDLIFVRPLGVVATVLGAALFVPAAIITSPTGMHGITEAYELLIGVPVEETFERRLGDL